MRVFLARGRVTSSSYELSENKVQLTRIRDKNDKFRSNSIRQLQTILNVTLA